MRPGLKLALAGLMGMAVGVLGSQALLAEPEIKRNLLRHEDLTATDKEVYMTVIDAAPGATFPLHTHPGDEFAYLLEGSVELDLADQPPMMIKPGDSVHIVRDKVHGGKIAGTTPAKLLTVHIIDKGKPITIPVK